MKKILLVLTLIILIINTTYADTLDCSNWINAKISKKITPTYKIKIDKILTDLDRKYSDKRLFTINQKIIWLTLKLKKDTTKYNLYLYLLTEIDKKIHDTKIINNTYIASECSIYNNNFNVLYISNNKKTKTIHENPLDSSYVIHGQTKKYMTEEDAKYTIDKNWFWIGDDSFVDFLSDDKYVIKYMDKDINNENIRLNNLVIYKKYNTWPKMTQNDIKKIKNVDSIKNIKWIYYPIDAKSNTYEILSLDSNKKPIYKWHTFINWKYTNIPKFKWYKIFTLDLYKKALEKKEYTLEQNKNSTRSINTKYTLPNWSPRNIAYEVWLSQKEYDKIASLEKQIDAIQQEYVKWPWRAALKLKQNMYTIEDLMKYQDLILEWKRILRKQDKLHAEKRFLLEQKWIRKNVCVNNASNTEGLNIFNYTILNMYNIDTYEAIAYKHIIEKNHSIRELDYIIRHWGQDFYCSNKLFNNWMHHTKRYIDAMKIDSFRNYD